MGSNPLLKWLLVPVALLLVWVGVRLSADGESQPPTLAGEAARLTPDEMHALGIAGDTPQDTVATLVAQVKQLRGELQRALGDNRQHKAENERLRAREGAIDQRIEQALAAEHKRLEQARGELFGERQVTQSLLQELQLRLDALAARGAPELPIGLGLEPGDLVGESAGLRWIEPEELRTESQSAGQAKPVGFGLARPERPALAEAVGEASGQVRQVLSGSTRAVYTLPANATLMGSVAMTALIGRVPIDGTVNDPYPFKVLIGADNLTANGIELPDVAGAVVSGTASGDWTLSCVRGQIRSITFVFQDGTVRTLPEEGRQARGGSGMQDGLGWISDPQGNPCVSGERRSNAQQYLGTQALMTAAGAGAASLISSGKDSVAVVASGNGALGTVGIGGSQVMERILAGGVRDMADWVNKLYGQAFAAVYVQPGARVAVHLEQALAIDYDARGRRVAHRQEATHAAELD
ncbi:TIGR03752 family integrating conjugative element protein [Pseudomonas sp. RL]|uniref:TIGR03752 family integrating conjugative element protein n=1 Tax=Pseudomonas sp. RL TaxID=1452718 RepID=UPI0004822F07|nr:TIGR03752 family integrating conjugative element protein [Pseudomonas sp. RL]